MRTGTILIAYDTQSSVLQDTFSLRQIVCVGNICCPATATRKASSSSCPKLAVSSGAITSSRGGEEEDTDRGERARVWLVDKERRGKDNTLCHTWTEEEGIFGTESGCSGRGISLEEGEGCTHSYVVCAHSLHFPRMKKNRPARLLISRNIRELRRIRHLAGGNIFGRSDTPRFLRKNDFFQSMESIASNEELRIKAGFVQIL